MELTTLRKKFFVYSRAYIDLNKVYKMSSNSFLNIW